MNESLSEELSVKKQGEQRTLALVTQLQKKVESNEQEVFSLSIHFL